MGSEEQNQDEVFDDQHKAARLARFRTGAPPKDFGTVTVGKECASLQVFTPPLMEKFEEYDIEQMKARATKFSDVPCLKRRARRFDEETANELVQVKVAQRKNERFKRFKLGDAD